LRARPGGLGASGSILRACGGAGGKETAANAYRGKKRSSKQPPEYVATALTPHDTLFHEPTSAIIILLEQIELRNSGAIKTADATDCIGSSRGHAPELRCNVPLTLPAASPAPSRGQQAALSDFDVNGYPLHYPAKGDMPPKWKMGQPVAGVDHQAGRRDGALSHYRKPRKFQQFLKSGE
jgi:hypothetical protein